MKIISILYLPPFIHQTSDNILAAGILPGIIWSIKKSENGTAL